MYCTDAPAKDPNNAAQAGQFGRHSSPFSGETFSYMRKRKLKVVHDVMHAMGLVSVAALAVSAVSAAKPPAPPSLGEHWASISLSNVSGAPVSGLSSELDANPLHPNGTSLSWNGGRSGQHVKLPHCLPIRAIRAQLESNCPLSAMYPALFFQHA